MSESDTAVLSPVEPSKTRKPLKAKLSKSKKPGKVKVKTGRPKNPDRGSGARAIFRVELLPEVKESLAKYSEESGRSQFFINSRVVEWFCGLSPVDRERLMTGNPKLAPAKS
jgi:hypothetical protein